MAWAILPVPRKVILEKMLEGVGVVEKWFVVERRGVRRRVVWVKSFEVNMFGFDCLTIDNLWEVERFQLMD